MITGMHVILFSRNGDKSREFLGDALGLRSEHQVNLTCDDIAGVVAKLAERGMGTEGSILDRGWRLVTTLALAGGEPLGLYEPRHPSPLTEGH
jgi:hypothetical protein